MSAAPEQVDAGAADGANGAAGAAAAAAADNHGCAVEAERQSRLLALLRRDPAATATATATGVGLAGSQAQRARGLAAYRANAAATAPRALAAAYPTLAQWLGTEAFAAMARGHWLTHPPERGDLACWGDQLPEAMAQDPPLAGEPGLIDMAQLDWAVHRAGVAADDDQPPQGLMLLGQADPEYLVLRLRAGAAVISSPYPIVEIWRAHHDLAPPGHARGDDGECLARPGWRCVKTTRSQPGSPLVAPVTCRCWHWTMAAPSSPRPCWMG